MWTSYKTRKKKTVPKTWNILEDRLQRHKISRENPMDFWWNRRTPGTISISGPGIDTGDHLSEAMAHHGTHGTKVMMKDDLRPPQSPHSSLHT